MLLELPDVISQFYNNIRVPKTCIDYIIYIQNLIEHSGKSAVEEITDIDIQDYLNNIQYINKIGKVKKTSVVYMKAACSAFNQFFKYLCKRRMITGNFMDLIGLSLRKDSLKGKYLFESGIHDFTNM